MDEIEQKEGKMLGRLFLPEMMTAIKNRRKTQTRRPVTIRNTFFNGGTWPRWARDLSQFDWSTAKIGILPSSNSKESCIFLTVKNGWKKNIINYITPRVKIGDIFYTKETHAYLKTVSSTELNRKYGDRRVIYRAECDETEDEIITGSWRPSIFQRKEHARFHLQINGVHFEHVQDISEQDAIAEGVRASIVGSDLDHMKYRCGFETVWEGLYGGKPGKWKDNYVVIAYNFDIKEASHEVD